MPRPATGLVEPAPYPGEKPPEHPITSIVLVALTGAIDPFHAVRVAFVVFGPQLDGVASGARGPPLNCSRKRLNGTIGVLSKVAVSRPVFGSASIEPGSFTTNPGPRTTK